MFVDETPVLDPGRGRTKAGYFWTIARDDRPWGGSDAPAVVYLRSGPRHALALLKDIAGILQSDGYRAYKSVAEARHGEGGILLAHCWAHARRQFFDIAKQGPAPIAQEALKRVTTLYEIEAEDPGPKR